jgi:hypothetical protein
MQPVLERYCDYQPNSDGKPDIESLTYLPFGSSADSAPADARLTPVLVEKRRAELRVRSACGWGILKRTTEC